MLRQYQEAFRKTQAGIEAQATEQRTQLETEAESYREEVRLGAGEAKGEIRAVASEAEIEHQREARRLREAEREEQRKRMIPSYRPVALQTEAKLKELEKIAESFILGKARIAREDVEEQETTALLDIGKALEKITGELEVEKGKVVEEVRQQFEAESARAEALAKAREEALVEFREITEEVIEPPNAIKLDTGEYIDKGSYNALSKDEQTLLNSVGVAEYNGIQQEKVDKFHRENVELDTGEYIAKASFDKLSETAEKYLRQYGIDKYNAWANERPEERTLKPTDTTYAVDYETGIIYEVSDPKRSIPIAFDMVFEEQPVAEAEEVGLPTMIWRLVTPWEEEKEETLWDYVKATPDRLMSPDVESQKDLKAGYEAQESAPLWAQLLFGQQIIHSPTTGEYIRLVYGEAPLVGGGKLKPARILTQVIEINWNKLIPPTVNKPQINWNQIVKAIRAGEVKDAISARRWADVWVRRQAARLPPRMPMTPAQVARQRALTQEGMRLASEAAAKVRAAESVQKVTALVPQVDVPVVQWQPFKPQQLTTARMNLLIGQWLAMKPHKAIEQMIQGNLVTFAVATDPQAIRQILSKATPTQATKVLEKLEPKIKQAFKMQDWTQAQNQAQIQTQAATQLATIQQQAVELGRQLQTQGKTQSQIKEAIQQQVKTQIQNITDTQTRAQIQPLAQQIVDTATRAIVEPITRRITRPITRRIPRPVTRRIPRPIRKPEPIKPRLFKILKIPLLPEAEPKKWDERKPIPPATVVMKMGRPRGFPDGMWNIIPPPYNEIYYSGRIPAGVTKIASGVGSAAKTLQVINQPKALTGLGLVGFKEVFKDIGAIHLRIFKDERGKIAVEFTRDPVDAYKGRETLGAFTGEEDDEGEPVEEEAIEEEIEIPKAEAEAVPEEELPPVEIPPEVELPPVEIPAEPEAEPEGRKPRVRKKKPTRLPEEDDLAKGLEAMGSETMRNLKLSLSETLTDTQQMLQEHSFDIEGKKEELEESRLRKLLPVWDRIQKRIDQPTDVTLKEYREITGREYPRHSTTDKFGRVYVKWDDAIDEVATEYGYDLPENLYDALGLLASTKEDVGALHRLINMGEERAKEVERTLEILTKVEKGVYEYEPREAEPVRPELAEGIGVITEGIRPEPAVERARLEVVEPAFEPFALLPEARPEPEPPKPEPEAEPIELPAITETRLLEEKERERLAAERIAEYKAKLPPEVERVVEVSRPVHLSESEWERVLDKRGVKLQVAQLRDWVKDNPAILEANPELAEVLEEAEVKAEARAEMPLEALEYEIEEEELEPEYIVIKPKVKPPAYIPTRIPTPIPISIPTRIPTPITSRLDKELLPEYRNGLLKVYLVNRGYVEKQYDISLDGGASDVLIPSIIPQNEIWVARSPNESEVIESVLAQLVARRLVVEKGLDPERARLIGREEAEGYMGMTGMLKNAIRDEFTEHPETTPPMMVERDGLEPVKLTREGAVDRRQRLPSSFTGKDWWNEEEYEEVEEQPKPKKKVEGVRDTYGGRYYLGHKLLPPQIGGDL